MKMLRAAANSGQSGELINELNIVVLSPQSSNLPVAFEKSTKVRQGAIGRMNGGWDKRLRQHRVAHTKVAGQRPPQFSLSLATARHHEAAASLIIALPGLGNQAGVEALVEHSHTLSLRGYHNRF